MGDGDRECSGRLRRTSNLGLRQRKRTGVKGCGSVLRSLVEEYPEERRRDREEVR